MDLAITLGYDVLGFIDRDTAKLGTAVGARSLPVVATEADLHSPGEFTARFPGVHVALGIGRNAERVASFHKLSTYVVSPLIHPSACVSETAVLGPGTVVMPNAVVNADARIGSAVIVNTGSIIEHDCELQDGVHVSPGAILSGGVSVGSHAWIGAGATILPGLRLGPHCVIGAGAVVTRDIADSVVALGVPARRVNHQPRT